MKIFVSAYACEPNFGSEIGVGWHWVLEMSKYFELWVLTRESNKKNIEPWIVEHPEYSEIHWLYYDLPKWARWWKKGLRGVRTYYNIWQYMTNSIVKKTMQENDIHVFHHLTYGNALWKVSSYGQKQTFIWGPIGGLETIPFAYSKHYGWKWRLIECVRRTATKLLPLNVGFHNRCKNADMIFCKTEDTKALIPDQYKAKAQLMTDVAVERSFLPTSCKVEEKQNGSLSFLAVGRLDAWRGFDLVIEAFTMLANKRKDVNLTIIGEGSDRSRLLKIIDASLCKERINMVGAVSQEQYQMFMQKCDIVVNAALKEGAVTVAFDAIANTKPIVCVETGGYTKSLTPLMSEVINKHNRAQTIQELYNGMERFCNQEERLNAIAECKNLTNSLSWEVKGKAVRDAILEITKC